MGPSVVTMTMWLILTGGAPSLADVSVTVTGGGNLTVIGDSGDNEIFVQPGVAPGDVDVGANSPINGGGMTTSVTVAEPDHRRVLRLDAVRTRCVRRFWSSSI
jgi:hypothetical protein